MAFVGDQWLQVMNGYLHMATIAHHIAPSHYNDPGYHGRGHGGHNRSSGPPRGLPPPKAPRGLARANLYEHINFDGDRLYLSKNRVWPDLSKVSMGFFSGSWNDKISSVETESATLVLFEHARFVGSTLLLPARPARNFVELGWNDRVSSIKNFGYIY